MHHPLGTLLLQEHMLKEEDLERVERICEEHRCSFEDAVTRLGLLTPETLASFKEHLPTVAPGELLELDPTLIPRIPHEIAHRFGCMPVAWFGGTLTIAVPDPQDDSVLSSVREAVGCPIDAVPGLESDLRQAVEYHYGGEGETAEAAAAVVEEPPQQAVQEAAAGQAVPNADVGDEAEEQLDALIREKRKEPAAASPAGVEDAPPAAEEDGFDELDEILGPETPAADPAEPEAPADAPAGAQEEESGPVAVVEEVPAVKAPPAEARAPEGEPESGPAPGPIPVEDVEVLVEDLEAPPPQVRLAHSFLGRMVARGAQRLELRWKRDQLGEAVLHAGGEKEHLMAVPTGQMPLVIQRYRVLGDMLLQSRKKAQKGSFSVKIRIGRAGRRGMEDRRFLITIVPIGDLEGEVATLAPATQAGETREEHSTPTEDPARKCPACGEREILGRFRYCPMCGIGVG